jgi:hypothetical protein
MKEITSRASKKTEIITDDVWDIMVASGMSKRFTMRDLPERKIIQVPIIKATKPKEIKIKKNG